MPNRIFLDTSFVAGLINEKDQYHEEAEALSYKFENSPLITTNAILLEIGSGLAKDYRKEAVETVSVLRGSKNVEVVQIDDRLLDDGLEIYRKYTDKKWGLVDCTSFVVMWENSITEALTFDSDFEQAGFTVLKGESK
jgi:hypothetical protein